MISDEGAHAMDSFFYYSFFRDFFLNPEDLFNVKDYVFKFYVRYPALYITYYSPLFGLLTSGLFHVFGVTQLTARLTSMFFSIASLIMIYFLGMELYDERTGFLSVLVLALAPFFFIFSTQIMQEVPLLFFVLFSTLLFYKGVEKDKKYFYYFGIVFGLGMMMKYMIIVLIVPLLFYLYYRKKFTKNLSTILKAGLIGFTIFLPYLLVLVFFGGFEIIGYWLSEKARVECPVCPSSPLTPLYFYPYILGFEIFPLVVLIPFFYFIWKRPTKKEDVFLILIIISYFTIFLLLPMKTSKYIIPTLPFFSLLFVHCVKRSKTWITIILIVVLIQLSICLFNPPYYIIGYEHSLKENLENIGDYLNENNVENGNVFLFPGLWHSGIIFNFAKSNNFENFVFRWRPCTFQNMTVEDFEKYIEDKNIYLIVAYPENPDFEPFRGWLDEHFERDIVGNSSIYINPSKEFKPLEVVCEYNCKTKKSICYDFR